MPGRSSVYYCGSDHLCIDLPCLIEATAPDRCCKPSEGYPLGGMALLDLFKVTAPLELPQVQNYIVNLQVNYNISRASDLPTTLSPSGQDFCPQAHYFLSWFRGSALGKSLPSHPLSCLLLKPISAHYAHCPICSPYRPTCASVLLGYIDSISVTTIICYTL